jgi:hypothetical protein
LILTPQKYPVFLQMASGTSSTATLFTLPSYTSRSCKIFDPLCSAVQFDPQLRYHSFRFILNNRGVVIFLIFYLSLRGYSRHLHRTAEGPGAFPRAFGAVQVSNLPAAPNQSFPGSRLLIRNIIAFLKHCPGVPPTEISRGGFMPPSAMPGT